MSSEASAAPARAEPSPLYLLLTMAVASSFAAGHSLARLAYGTGQDFHLTSFLTYLRADRIETFDARQRAAVEALLVHLSIALTGELSDDDYLDLEWALRRVRGEPGPCSYAGPR